MNLTRVAAAIEELDARRQEIDQALIILRALIRSVTSESAPPPTKPVPPTKVSRVAGTKAAAKTTVRTTVRTKTNGIAAGILAFLRGKPSTPRAAIFAAVKGATPYHLKQLVASNAVLATGNTFSRRYAVPASTAKPAAPTVTVPDMEIVFNGAKGQSLSSYASKPRG